MLPMLAAKTVIQGIPLSHTTLGLALIMFAVALPAFISPKKFHAAMEDFLNAGNAVLRLSGLFILLMAFLILNTRWKFLGSSKLNIMVVVGYLMVVKGLLRLWFPEYTRSVGHKIMQKPWSVYAIGSSALILALLFGYLGLY